MMVVIMLVCSERCGMTLQIIRCYTIIRHLLYKVPSKKFGIQIFNNIQRYIIIYNIQIHVKRIKYTCDSNILKQYVRIFGRKINVQQIRNSYNL